MLLALHVALDSVKTAGPGAVQTTVQAYADFLLKYAIALAAVGALSMALIEAVKTLIDAKTRFQARRWTAFIKDTWEGDPVPVSAPGTLEGSGSDASRIAAYAQLLQLCTGITAATAQKEASRLLTDGGNIPLTSAFDPDDAHAVFALDLSKMMGSIQDAADLALDTPKRYEPLYRLMVWGADPADINAWFGDADAVVKASGTMPATPEDRANAKTRAERYTSLKMVVKRKLDAFQLRSGDRWATGNQVASNLVGMVLLAVVLFRLNAHLDATQQMSDAKVLVLSIFGGVLAPVAKDLVTALQKVRNG